MPKRKKKYQYQYPRPAISSHPSLSLSKPANAIHGSAVPNNCSVAECLKTLRNEEAKRLPIRPSPVATVHPSLRVLLDVPESPQPSGRLATQGANPSHIRRIPGPAAPPSWQLPVSRQTSMIAESEYLGASEDAPQWLADEQTILPGAKWPSSGTLLHKVLRTMAQQWDWHLNQDHVHLASIPLHLREVLLTYIRRYASEETLTRSSNTLHILFPDRNEFAAGEGAHQTSMEDATEVTRLDLGRALGTWLLRASSLKKEFTRPVADDALLGSGLGIRHLRDSQGLTVLPDSWEDVDTAANQCFTQHPLSPSLQKPLIIRFPGLLHLSLTLPPSMASPVSVASWSSLLSITANLSTLQSLALGYWPCPTLVPRAAAVSATIGNPASETLSRRRYRGTDMYTESDSGWQEAAGILRRLSRHLYCLRWLDLTGCGSWFAALTWTDIKLLDDGSVSEARLSETGPDWNGSWRNVQYLRLCVGWTLPRTEDTEHSPISSFEGPSDPPMRPYTVTRGSNADTNGHGLNTQDWDPQEERRKYLANSQVEKYEATKVRAREVASILRVIRHKARGKWVEVCFEDG